MIPHDSAYLWYVKFGPQTCGWPRGGQRLLPGPTGPAAASTSSSLASPMVEASRAQSFGRATTGGAHEGSIGMVHGHPTDP